MRYNSYKQLLQEINKTQDVSLKISIWTYNSNRMPFMVPLEQIQHCLNGDLTFKHNDQKLKLQLGGKHFCYRLSQLKIAKVDFVKILDREAS